MRLGIVLTVTLAAAVSVVHAQTNVSQVVMASTLTARQIVPAGGFTPAVSGKQVTGTLPTGLLNVYTVRRSSSSEDFLGTINNPLNYDVANASALTSAISTNIAVALSDIPLSSPTSGVIIKTDPATGAELPVSGTLGPIFTQRAETVGKGKVYVGFTHQNYHFTSLNETKLNGLPLLYTGGDQSAITNGGTNASTAPATVNFGLDVRLVQDVAFLTFGITNNFDVSVGLPAVHSSVASTSYNGVIYSGSGTDFNNGSRCWCVNTFTPGSVSLSQPLIGNASAAKSGFGDLLLRFKGGVYQGRSASLSVGADLRLPTGDADNYLGTGTTSVKPFVAVSLYTPRTRGIVLAPHFEAGWQFSGKSILGGTLQGTRTDVQVAGVGTLPVVGTPFTASKDYLPDIFSWGAGTEIALGRSNTLVVDFLGNEIGMIHGIRTLRTQKIDPSTAPAPTLAVLPGTTPMTSGLAAEVGRNSFAQYSGAFGYKIRLFGNLVATAQALVRFDDNGLTARVTPLYGIGYSFGR